MAATENREDEYLWEMDYREGKKSESFGVVLDVLVIGVPEL